MIDNVKDIGDGGHCYRILEPNGYASVIIAVNTPPPPRPPKPIDPFEVRPASDGHDVMSTTGETVATTTDKAMADRICKLLILHERAKARRASTDSASVGKNKPN